MDFLTDSRFLMVFGFAILALFTWYTRRRIDKKEETACNTQTLLDILCPRGMSVYNKQKILKELFTATSDRLKETKKQKQQQFIAVTMTWFQDHKCTYVHAFYAESYSSARTAALQLEKHYTGSHCYAETIAIPLKDVNVTLTDKGIYYNPAKHDVFDLLKCSVK